MIPSELRELKGWLLWKLVQADGEPKPRKVPYCVDGRPRRGKQGSPEDRARLATYDAAARVLADDLAGEYSGLGFAMLEDWGVVGLDFDHCVDANGVVDPAVEAVIDGTYAEYSPSGTGVHAFLTGSIANAKSHWTDWGWGFETFCSTGFLTMTGHATPVCELVGVDSLEHLNGAVTELFETRFGANAIKVRVPRDVGAPVTPPLGLTEDEVRALLWRCTPDGKYPDWVRRGLSLHHESGGAQWGCDLWVEHSLTGVDPSTPEVMQSKWNGFDSSGSDGRPVVTIAYLYSIAAPDDSAFDVIVEKPDDPPPVPTFARDRAGAILPTMDNAVMAVGRADLCGLRIAHDDFRDEITIAAPGTDEWLPMTDADVVRLRIALERMRFKTAPKEMVRDAVVLVAAQNRYDSAQLWLGRLKWDGTPRVERFLETYLGCAAGSAYVRAVSLYIWTALAGRVLEPGVKADMVPIFEGGQGLRKSTAIEAMSPAPEFFVEIDLGDKEDDTVRKLRGALVGEIAELSGLHTRELEGIKKFVVRKVEKWVPKYKEFPSTFKRRLLFIGTTNRVDILADDTGNRRWLPLHIERADAEGIARDREQLWAEGAALFQGRLPGVHVGGVAWEAAERLAPSQHEAYAVEDAWDSLISGWLASVDDMGAVGGPRGELPFTTADVLSGALRLQGKDMNRNAANRVGAILRSAGFEQKATWIDGRTSRAWVAKPNGEKTER